MPNLQIIVHVLHPPPSADSRQKGYPLPDFYSGATGNPAASVRDYCSGAYSAAVFHHACKLGAEGIVSKRLGSRYRSGRSPDWLKLKNPEAPAVRREAEEDWGR
jgi:hypothetical protein